MESSDEMAVILLVLVAHVLDQLGVWREPHLHIDRPRLRIRLRIVECHVQLHVADIEAPEPLRDMQCLGVRTAGQVEPCPIVEPGAVHDERVALPVADRVPHPRRIGIRWKAAAVQEDLAGRGAFIKYEQQVGGLNELDRIHAE